LKLFEYMALGKPIVASNLPAFREVLSAEEAVLVEPGSPSAIAAAIAQLLQRPSFAARLAFNAFQSATHYTWDARARQLERVISAVLSPAPRGRPA
jgi:glycosyltransferase involved in cell wall biosynthesis